MGSMPDMSMVGDKAMSHTMSMQMKHPRIGDSIDPPSSRYRTSLGTKYQPLRAAFPTNDPNKPIAGVINIELLGY